MNELYKKCREIVEENIEADLQVKELITLSVLAIVLVKEKQAIQELPKILKSLKVKIDNKPFKEIEKDNNYQETNHQYVDIKTEIFFRQGMITENKELVLSLYNIEENLPEIIKELTTVLIKELRSNPMKISSAMVERKIGISTYRKGLEEQDEAQTYKTIESTLEEKEAREAIKSLREYCDKTDSEESKLIEILKKAEKIQVNSIFEELLEILLQDSILKQTLLLGESEKEIRKGIYYYNLMMEDDSSFLRLNRLFDELSNAIKSKNEKKIEEYIQKVSHEIETFNQKPKKYRLQ